MEEHINWLDNWEEGIIMTDTTQVEEHKFNKEKGNELILNSMTSKDARGASVKEYKEPTTYYQMTKRGSEEKAKWLDGVEKEFQNFDKRNVWRVIKIKDVPLGRRLIGSKWVFKKKRDGRHRTRLVALGYHHIPGIDYAENYSPVAGDMSLTIILILWTVFELHCGQFDVETAFLEGRLEPKEYQYMRGPDGVQLNNDECYEITGGMYGLVQVARIFWIRLSKILKGASINMKQ